MSTSQKITGWQTWLLVAAVALVAVAGLVLAWATGAPMAVIDTVREVFAGLFATVRGWLR